MSLQRRPCSKLYLKIIFIFIPHYPAPYTSPGQYSYSEFTVCCNLHLFIQVSPLTLLPFSPIKILLILTDSIQLLIRKFSLILSISCFLFQLPSAFIHTLLCGTLYIYFPTYDCLCTFLIPFLPICFVNSLSIF